MREIIRRQVAKAPGLPADKIAVYVQSDEELGETAAKNQLIIAKETKSAGLKFQRPAKTAAEAGLRSAAGLFGWASKNVKLTIN